jgi:hypothetical protein
MKLLPRLPSPHNESRQDIGVKTIGIHVVRWLVVLSGATSWAGGSDAPAELNGGFRMEGDPKIETVFGDAEQFRKYIDRFFTVQDEMKQTREDFSRNVHAVLASLAGNQPIPGAGRGPRVCPTDAVALTYARAFRLGQTYHRHGKELEANVVSIKDLDSLGETSGLTPDYRWKVAKALKLYPEILKDFREMRASFQTQLAGEVRYHGCDAQDLIAKGEELEKAGPPPTGPTARPGTPLTTNKLKKDSEKLAPPVSASTATFFIDNASCGTSLRVFVDGALVGEVASSAKAAFQTSVGRHDLCLIQSTSRQLCGEPGTVRRTYVHDGWSITLRCD